MDITDNDVQALKEGLRDIVHDQYGKKVEAVSKIIDEHDRQYRDRQRSMSKDGRRFSQSSKDALDEHVQHLHDTAEQMKSMSRELGQHAKKLAQHANDLTELYRSEGQGPAFATDSA
jgi:hypothetical protein